jgi:hypothetical protein
VTSPTSAPSTPGARIAATCGTGSTRPGHGGDGVPTWNRARAPCPCEAWSGSSSGSGRHRAHTAATGPALRALSAPSPEDRRHQGRASRPRGRSRRRAAGSPLRAARLAPSAAPLREQGLGARHPALARGPPPPQRARSPAERPGVPGPHRLHLQKVLGEGAGRPRHPSAPTPRPAGHVCPGDPRCAAPT